MGVQTGFCEGGRKYSGPLTCTRVSIKRASTVHTYLGWVVQKPINANLQFF